jgi:hypothetical protein
MGALTDLSNHQREEFDELTELIRSRKGYCAPFEQGFLVDLYKQFDFMLLRVATRECMLNNWLKVTQIGRLASLMHKHGIEKTQKAIERMTGRENYSQDTVEGILKGEIPEKRKPIVHPKDKLATDIAAAARKPKVAYPTPNHIFDRSAASYWLSLRDHSVDEWPQYFEMASRDDSGNQLYKLKAEYR